MRIANGKVFDGQCFRERDVVVEGQAFSRIEASGAATCDAGGADTVDASGCYVIPGLIDVHFHGAMGHDFCDASDEGISAIAAYEASRGVTSICPTTMTLPEERLAPIVDSVAAHEVAAGEAGIVGINMEGPFIAPDKVGAQNPAYVRSASLEEFARLQEQAQGLIKLVDVAPEQPGNLEFIRQVSHDVRVSVAHTCTGYDDACAAFDAGARHMTHLFNAMPALHHREPGPIAAGAERNDVTAEIIADGVHIHPAMVRLAFALFGDDRMILISDSLRACGLGDGEYELGGQQFFVKGNRATIANGSLAGSVSDVMACMRTAVRTMGIPLTSAVKAATVNPARALGLDGKLGAIAPGYQADAVVLDRDLNIKHVVLRGKAIASR
ncbi:N-acetylglucosamine-6-phosphate deacetylase [uncultured Senegalimassilia sp.]|uniref:N-acetylglucosamine-6-phosphate deacetylase n=1 Tax=uncultured Senegalimassilia sp. TaxID=1714350 RepID=UPI0025D24784|nr:N-acetylglucosamine-6-phosphate deacetylase [uncultured Senegalimassilia sp.]